MGPGWAIFAFAAIFLLIASGGLLLFYREAVLQRISDVINPPEKKPVTLREKMAQTGSSLTGMVGQFERVLPKSEAEVGVVQQRLIRAGYRKETALKLFYGAKFLVPVTICAVCWATGLINQGPFFVLAAGGGLGFLAPDFWLGRQISLRQKKIRRGLPDMLDLLVICIEAGLSLDQAVQRTAEELSKAQPVIGDELTVVVLEQRAGRPRAEAWRHLSERTDVDSLRNLVSVLIQSEQFGTSIAKTLRVHSDTLRTQRVQKVEEQAAKTTIKLIFPLVLFIFPSLFLVVLGPPAIMMSESFQKLFNH